MENRRKQNHRLPRWPVWLAIACLGAGFLAHVPAGFVSEALAQPFQEETPRPTRVRVSEGVSQGLLIKKVEPVYPQEAREKHIQGLVVMKAEISQEGDVTEVDLISGHPLLAPAALEAVKQWKYKPYLLNGKPVIVETQVSVSFQLTAK